jgi:uncharacterized protein (TIGR00369 family)
MDSEIQTILEDCLQHADKDDLLVIKQLLQGIHQKQIQKKGAYIGTLLQMVRKLDKTTCELTIPINPLTMNNLGIVHGGITATVIDSAMGALAGSLVPPGYATVTTQLNIHFIAPGLGDYLYCKAKVEHKGTKTIVLSATVVTSDGKKIAKSTGSFFIIERQS